MSPAFRIIHDPGKLINVANDKVAGLIQHFQHLAPSPGVYYEKLADSIEKSSPSVYGSAQNKFSVPIYTFVKDNKLYTIIKTDSLLYLAAHKNDSLIKIQTIVDTSIEMQHLSFTEVNKSNLVTFLRYLFEIRLIAKNIRFILIRKIKFLDIPRGEIS